MQALQLFGLLIMAFFSNKQKNALEGENSAMVTETDMVRMEEAVAAEEAPDVVPGVSGATEWIAEEMVVEEEAIANYEPALNFEEAAMLEELQDADDMSPPTIEMPDSSAMNLQANWVTRVKEFGIIPTGPAAEFTFSFTNTGTEPITIIEVAPSCSCTVADYSKTPIQPGKQGWVKAVYETQGHPGFFKKFIRVEFADGSGTQLIVTGSVQ